MPKSEHLSKSPKDREQREVMGDRELGNLLAGVGNHEGQALLFAFMKKGKPYSRKEHFDLIMGVQGDDKVWTMDRNVPFDWSNHSFAQIGLVTKVTIDPSKGVCYEKNDYGDEVGMPLVGFLLSLSAKYPVSLYHIFGSTQSTGKVSEIQNDSKDTFKQRSPLTRYRLLKALNKHIDTKNPSLRQIDLARILQTTYPDDYANAKPDALLKTHVRGLAQNGIISYAGIEADMPYSAEGKFSMGVKSEITLNDNQKALISELVEGIEKFKQRDPDFLKQASTYAKELHLIENQELVRKLLKKSYESSSQTTVTNRYETAAHLLDFMEGHPEGISINQLRAMLAEAYGKTLSVDSIRGILGLVEGRLDVFKKGKSKFYRLKPDPESTQTIFDGK